MKTPQDWLDTYYPIPADDPSIVTDEQAIDHAIRKWEGLGIVTLIEHGLQRSNACVSKIGEWEIIIRIDADTCALCIKHYGSSYIRRCMTCPLYAVNGGMPCDSGAAEKSAYALFTDCGETTKMLQLLKLAKEQVTAK